MFIQQIISYGNAWNNLVERYPQELAEIKASIAALTLENIAAAQPLRDVPHYQEPGITRYRLDGCWATLLQTCGWVESTAAVRSVGGRPIQMRGLGYLKDRVAVTLARHREVVNRWLYTLAPIATRNDYVSPLGVAP